jgi:hypothetical protein
MVDNCGVQCAHPPPHEPLDNYNGEELTKWRNLYAAKMGRKPVPLHDCRASLHPPTHQ